MRSIKFCKFHGFGNDYIVFETDDLRDVSSLGEFAQEVCRRNTGVGGDGIAVLQKPENERADYSCRIINPDGSEAGFSGNGTRCAAAFLYYKNLWREKSLKLETKSGIKTYELLEKNNRTFQFLAELGKPQFGLPGVPQQAVHPETGKELEMAKFSNLLIPSKNIIMQFVCVDVGNPVACIYVENFDAFDWRECGRMIESHFKLFPDRTNVVFVRVVDRENIEIRIWERGAGETSSSGTCSIAAAVASAFVGVTERKISVHAPGGTTETVWREDDEMLITGRADLVFCGEWFE